MSRPNVVIILADDLGFSDAGCFGGEIPTPNLDALAERGVRMSNFYATPRCSPSRASLMTGRHPHETGIGILTADDRPDGYPGSLDPSVPTMAELLRGHGYSTCVSGKWHLASDTVNPNDSWPTRRGFDEFFGILIGTGNYFHPRRLYAGENRIAADAIGPGFYLTDAITDHAETFIRSAHARRDPFLLYVAYTAPHFPLHAPEPAIRENAGRFRDGWDLLRERRMRRLVEAGLIPEAMPLSPRDHREPAWADVEDPSWQERRMEVYAAQIQIMDRGIGRLVDTLRTTGELDDTLIVFLSDNGACAEALPPRVEPGGDAAASGGDRRILGNVPGVMPGPPTTNASYGRAWANLSNTPFRLYKRWVHEGGIASPLIAHWPNGRLAAGTIDDGPAQLVDILPTLLSAIGTPAPDDLVGTDILPGWRGATDGVDRQRPLYWEHIGNAAIRMGRWKLVREHGRPWELYDLGSDRTELDDRAAFHRGIVGDLESRWRAWARDSGVIPWTEILRIYSERGRTEADAMGGPAPTA